MKFTACSLFSAVFGAASAAKLSKTVRVLGTEVTAAGEPQQALLTLVASATHATEDTVPDLGSLTSLAKMLSKSKADDATVTEIRTLVEGMLASLTDSHSATQASLSNFSLFTSCTTRKNDDITAAESVVTVGNYSNTTVLYNQCHSELAVLNATWQTCLGVQQDRLETKNARCTLFEGVDKGENYAAWFCSEDPYDNAASYKSYLQRNIGMLHDYEYKRDNCTTATTDYQAQVTECAGLAGPVSDKVVVCAGLRPGTVPANCGPRQASIAACNSYDNCWAAAEDAGEASLTTARALEASVMAEYRSLKRIQCLLDVLAIADDSDQTAKLQECIDKTHSAVAMSISTPTYPTQDSCTTFPCSNETLAEEGDSNAEMDDPTR